jgi:hypothetical protein
MEIQSCHNSVTMMSHTLTFGKLSCYSNFTIETIFFLIVFHTAEYFFTNDVGLSAQGALNYHLYMVTWVVGSQ